MILNSVVTDLCICVLCQYLSCGFPRPGGVPLSHCKCKDTALNPIRHTPLSHCPTITQTDPTTVVTPSQTEDHGCCGVGPFLPTEDGERGVAGGGVHAAGQQDARLHREDCAVQRHRPQRARTHPRLLWGRLCGQRRPVLHIRPLQLLGALGDRQAGAQVSITYRSCTSSCSLCSSSCSLSPLHTPPATLAPSTIHMAPA